MFENFLSQGSVLALALMVYGLTVMAESIRQAQLFPSACPPILRHPLSALIMFGAIPCAIWPAVYVGLFDGWLAGFLTWIGITPASIGISVRAVRGPLLGVHFIAASVAYPIGYYLSMVGL